MPATNCDQRRPIPGLDKAISPLNNILMHLMMCAQEEPSCYTRRVIHAWYIPRALLVTHLRDQQ